MKKEKSATVTDCINNQSVIELELTVFPHNGENIDVIVISTADGEDTQGVLLTPDDAETFANAILAQVLYHRAHKPVEILTDSDTHLTIQRAKATCNGNKLPDEVCISLKDEDSEMVGVLTFSQIEALIGQLQRLIGM